MIKFPSSLMEKLHHPWLVEQGEFVELRVSGRTLRQGYIEAVMPNGMGFWLAAEGTDGRQFVDAHDPSATLYK